MEKIFTLILLMLLTTTAKAQRWEPQQWKSFIIEQNIKIDSKEKKPLSFVNRYANKSSLPKGCDILYGAFYATHPISFSSASLVPDYIPPRKEKKNFLTKRTSQEVYADNQTDFEKMRRGEYTSSDWFSGLFRDVLEIVLTK